MASYGLEPLETDLTLELTQQAPVERDEGIIDKYGGEAQANWVVVAVLPCLFFWWKTESGRGIAREFAEPEATIFYTGGGFVTLPDADIREGDRIKQVETPAGEVVVDGPLRVVAFEQWKDHLDVHLARP